MSYSSTQPNLDIDPALLSMPGMSEYTPDVTQEDMLNAGAQAVMPMQQFETLAVDPSASQEEQEAFNNKYVKAVGEISLKAETLNYDDLEQQVLTDKARVAAVVNAAQAQQQQAMDVMKPFASSEEDDDENAAAAKTRRAYTLAA